MQKIIAFNGPPRTGKDTAGKICREIFGSRMAHVKFTDPIKRLAHKRLGIDCAVDAYEVLKDEPLPEFRGKTPRQFYIDTSDELKRVHGPHKVAELLGEHLVTISHPIIVNTDLGYDHEAEALLRHVGPEGLTVIRLYREGKSFDGDCRSWVYPKGIASYDLVNGDLSEMREELRACFIEVGLIEHEARAALDLPTRELMPG